MPLAERLVALREAGDAYPLSREEALERSYDTHRALTAIDRAWDAVSGTRPQRALPRTECRVRRAPRFIRGRSAVRRRAPICDHLLTYLAERKTGFYFGTATEPFNYADD